MRESENRVIIIHEDACGIGKSQSCGIQERPKGENKRLTIRDH